MSARRSLSEDEFLACFAEPMRDVTATAEEILDIWPYVDSVDISREEVMKIRDVARVYRDAHERFEQVLLGTDVAGIFLVVVINLEAHTIRGHRWLDLRAEYHVS